MTVFNFGGVVRFGGVSGLNSIGLNLTGLN